MKIDYILKIQNGKLKIENWYLNFMGRDLHLLLFTLSWFAFFMNIESMNRNDINASNSEWQYNWYGTDVSK